MPKPYNTLIVKGLKVEVKDGNVTQALRKFKNKVDDSGKLEDLRSKMFYEKPTTKRKRKKGAAKARLRKQLREQALPKKLY
jgi:small subunit ribosomal protein S21